MIILQPLPPQKKGCHDLKSVPFLPLLDFFFLTEIVSEDVSDALTALKGQASTIQLIHFTLQECLQTHPEPFGTAHSTMAEACLSYLNSEQVKALPIDPFSDLGRRHFSNILLYIGEWMQKGTFQIVEKRIALALNQFDTSSRLISWASIFYDGGFDKRSYFSGLHWASVFGIVKLVTSLMEGGDCDINEEYWSENVLLMWAARNGRAGVVRILLGREDVSLDMPNGDGLIPLCCAAWNGHEGVMKILLRRDEVGSGAK